MDTNQQNFMHTESPPISTAPLINDSTIDVTDSLASVSNYYGTNIRYSYYYSDGTCSDTSSAAYYFDICGGISQISNLISPISISPNPAYNTLNIKGIASKTIIKMYDVVGKLILEKETESDITIDTSQLSQGVYTLSAESNNTRSFNKVMIQK